MPRKYRTEEYREYRRGLYALMANERFAAGVCVRCRNPRDDPDLATCSTCRNKYAEVNRRIRMTDKERSKRSYNRKKQFGFCVRCGHPRPYGQRIYCLSCSEVKAALGKSLRAKRLTQGLCVRCGKPKPPGRYVNCLACRLKCAEYRNVREAHDPSGLSTLPQRYAGAGEGGTQRRPG